MERCGGGSPDGHRSEQSQQVRAQCQGHHSGDAGSILDAYGATLSELAATLREVQGGPSVRWIVPGEVSEADLRLVVKLVLGKKWAPDEEDEEEEEEETSEGEDEPNGGEDEE